MRPIPWNQTGQGQHNILYTDDKQQETKRQLLTVAEL